MAATSPQSTEHEHFHHAPEPSMLERGLNKGLDAVEKNAKPILIGILLIGILAVGLIVWKRSAASQMAAGWAAFNECRAPEDYIGVADKYSSSPVGDWARLQGARLFASEGLVQALTNRAASDASLNKAKDAYEILLKKKSAPQEVRQESLYGLATCLEALSDGDTKPAIDAYEALLKEFPQSPHRLWAESRIKQLKSGSAQDFYAWFRKQDPKPVDRTGPNDIPNLKDLIPDLSIEEGSSGKTPAEGETAPAVPEAGGEKPDMPAKPAAEFPAEGEKPATPAPSEKPAPAPETPAEKPAEPAPETPAEKPAEPAAETPAPPAESAPTE